ncbi:MAG: aminotransferase class III-fold pyridoxal phosphate-dependent enzyme [Desulfobacterales bacterium]|jgi:glutamate-1-semialdehyde 2,1-aminomutase|nr:aminotransferase class III-fold pyridoxal phosphate-dependent enzyme [Desulfobacterales bacterium]
MLEVSARQRYEEKFAQSKALFERARNVMPRGVSHDQWYADPFPIYMQRAEGARLWDVDGNEYIDYYGGHGGKLLGHAPPAVVAAVNHQIQKGTQYGAACDLAVEWAELVQRLVPSAERVEFMNSGSEAIMYGIRLARAFTRREKIVRFQYHFAGAYDGVSVGNKKPFDVPVSAGILPCAVKDTLVIPINSEEDLEAALRKRDVAVVMVEAAGASSGVVGIRPSFYSALRKLTTQYGTLLLFDEVVTGFRYSPGGVQAAVGVIPDLTALGKGVSGVMPGAGAIAGRQDIMDLFLLKDEEWNRYRRVAHSGTFNANPLCAAAGIAYLNIIATGTPTRSANQKARMLRDALQRQMDERHIQGCVYDSGFSVIHIYFGPCDLKQNCDRGVCLNAAKTRDLSTGQALFMNLALNGVKTPTRGYDALLSAAHTEEDIQKTAAAYGRSLDGLIREKRLLKGI